MHVIARSTGLYSAFALAVLVGHGLFVLWVVFGAILARSRPPLRWLHIASLTWGLLTEFLPWPCPLTLVEDWLESRAGTTPDGSGFLLHFMDKLIYPDLAPTILMMLMAMVATLNFSFYAWQMSHPRPSQGRTARRAGDAG
ncbi:MAG: DUF2784 domain-containing protein [Acidobacteria bacterium]|nr:DUF2784 domain-containing protein [Acidobacteriota bacterium]